MSRRTSESVTSPTPQEQDSNQKPLQNSESAASARAEEIRRVKDEIWEAINASFARQEEADSRLRRLEAGRQLRLMILALGEKSSEQCLGKEEKERNVVVNAFSDEDDDDAHDGGSVIIHSEATVPEKN